MLEVPIDQLSGDDTESELQRQESLQLFGARLDGLFQKQVSDRSLIEERWLKDTRQYNSEYEDDVLARIREAGGSEAFFNTTRVKCNAVESRLAEMLLPTDDRNWAIEPTPVPEMRQAQGQDDMATKDAARKASDRMQQRMDDQLAECGYNAVLRSVIHNMAVYGTGILKGPVIRNKAKQTFRKASQVDPVTGVPVESWELDLVEDLAPGAESVSVWDFFPDMRATSMDNCEFVFERHRFNKQRLRDLAKLPGFLADQINAVLESEPDKSYSGMVDTADSADKHSGSRSGYEVLEYHGPIEPEDLIAAGIDVDPADRLTTYTGTVWICQRRVLKAVLSLLNSGEIMYDVVALERDDTMIFGFGVPYLMRHSQRAGNAAWRMVLDNARMSVGGQIITKNGKIRPKNGDYRLAPLKAWEVTDPNSSVADVFAIVNIPTNFQEMFRILEVVRQMQDEETGLPQIAQGQQAPTVTKTAQGMSILMNSANTVLRRMVKEFDDAITARFIKRLYHYNMQFGDDEEAKGDYCVIALGSSSLMVREQQSAGLMQLSQLGAANPEFAKRTKWGDLYRTIVKSLNINADGLVKTEDEVRAEQEQQAAQGGEIPPELQLELAKLEMGKAELEMKAAAQQADLQIKQAKAQAEATIAQARTESEREQAQMDFDAERMKAMATMREVEMGFARMQMEQELAVMKIAAERDMTMQQVRKEFGIKAMEIESKHQLFSAEREIKDKHGLGI